MWDAGCGVGRLTQEWLAGGVTMPTNDLLHIAVLAVAVRAVVRPVCWSKKEFNASLLFSLPSGTGSVKPSISILVQQKP